jgi:hypothetical protein
MLRLERVAGRHREADQQQGPAQRMEALGLSMADRAFTHSRASLPKATSLLVPSARVAGYGLVEDMA